LHFLAGERPGVILASIGFTDVILHKDCGDVSLEMRLHLSSSDPCFKDIFPPTHSCSYPVGFSEG
jgi:hypothetical protein